MDGNGGKLQQHFTPLQMGNPSLAGFNIKVKVLPGSEKRLIDPLTGKTQTQSNQDGASVGNPRSTTKILKVNNAKVLLFNNRCCVPHCTSSRKKQPHLAFHEFPDDIETRNAWLHAIKGGDKAFRGVVLVKEGFTYVCEEHFQPEDYQMNPTKCLKPGAIPYCFEFPPPAVYSVASEHNYCKEVNDIKLTLLRMQRDKLVGECQRLEEAAQRERYSVLKFADSDDAIQFYTRFPTYNHLMAFWKVLEPAASQMEYYNTCKKRNRKILASPAELSPLSRLDEFFLFMARLVQGLELLDLAQLFKVEPSSANTITRSWANFLYTFLASVPTWISKENVRAQLPVEFQHFPDTQVVIDFMEFRCRTPLSHWEEEEGELHYAESECDATVKAMVGMAPHGLVTFVSSVFPGSLSDEEVFRRSGIIPLLSPRTAIMVDESLDVDDLVSCKVHQLPYLSKEKEMVVYNMKRSTKLLRLYVDQMFLRVRDYELFKSIIPLSTAHSLNQMFTVACKLVNYQYY